MIFKFQLNTFFKDWFSLNLDKVPIVMYFFSVSANEFVVIKKNAVSCVNKSDIKTAFKVIKRWF